MLYSSKNQNAVPEAAISKPTAKQTVGLGLLKDV